MRSASIAIIGLSLALALAFATSAVASPAQFRSCEGDTLRADEQLAWTPLIVVVNTGTRGLYVDSLWLDVRDSRGDTSRFDFQTLVRGMAAISVGDSARLRLNVPAEVERGSATLKMVGHDGDQTRVRESVRFTIDGGALDAHPSQRTRVDGRTIEWVRVPADPSAAPAAGAPGVLLVHGEGGHARTMLRTARVLAAQGMAVMCVSLPGAGESDGSDDWMGPASRRAVALALDSLAASPGVDRTRIAVWGVSRGASVALLVAAERSQLAGVVAQSAIYDVWSAHRRAAGSALAASLVREVGSDSAAWRQRSPLVAAVDARPRVLVLHGELDTVSPVAEARDFAARRQAHGLTVSEQIVKGQPHDLPRGATQRAALAFLRESLGLTRP